MGERMATVEAQVRAIVEARDDRDREMKQLKLTLNAISKNIDLLVQDKARRDGALGLGRWLILVGLPSLVGGAVIWLWQALGGQHG